MRVFHVTKRKNQIQHSITRLRDLYSDLLTILHLEQDLEPIAWDLKSADSADTTTTITTGSYGGDLLYQPVALKEEEDLPWPEKAHGHVQVVDSDFAGLDSTNNSNNWALPNECPSHWIWYQLSAVNISITFPSALGSHENDLEDLIREDHPYLDDTSSSLLLLTAAREKEAQVVEIIRSIGEIVIYGEKNTRWSSSYTITTNTTNVNTNNQVFEYFCDKNMLSLLVDIMMAKPSSCSTRSSSTYRTAIRYSGVVWTASVKAQILQTISIFVSNVSDQRSLYYLLSSNSVNKIIMGVVPLEQWSDSALDEILPVYISFLKSMALQLANKPDLFHFFYHPNGQESGNDSPSIFLPLFPLLYAAVEVTTSTCKGAQSDTFVQTTALNIILNIFQLEDPNISSIILQSRVEQHMLMSHLCQQLNERYLAIIDIMIGKHVSSWRQEALVCECRKLEDVLHLVTDFLWSCSKSSIDISKRLCEYILANVMNNPVLDNLMIHSSSLCDEPHDCEYSEARAKCISSLLFITLFFFTLDYVPLRRMVAVAVFHPYKPHKMWIRERKNMGGEFVIAPALNEIMMNHFTVLHDDPDQEQNDKEEIDFIKSSPLVKVESNDVRNLLHDILSGNMGHGAFVLVSLFAEKILQSEDLNLNMLQTFGLLPSSSTLSPPSSCWLVSSLSSYLNTLPNNISTKTNEYELNMAISLSASTMIQFSRLFRDNNDILTEETIAYVMDTFKPLIQSVSNVRYFLASRCKDSLSLPLPENLIPDMMERIIQHLYSLVDSKTAYVEYWFDVQSFFSKDHTAFCNILTESTATKRDVEYDQNSFMFRALLLINALDHICAAFQKVFLSNRINDIPNISTRVKASSEIALLGSLNLQSIVGTDFVIKNQRYFRFSPSLALSDIANSKSKAFTNGTEEKDKRRELADKILLMASSKSSEFLLVVDDDELLVVKPKVLDSCEGTILCCTLINNVIAIASDEEWLHIAIRNAEDVGVLISKGNMALRFRSAEECLRVKDYIQGVKSTWCAEMVEKIHQFCVSCEL